MYLNELLAKTVINTHYLFRTRFQITGLPYMILRAA